MSPVSVGLIKSAVVSRRSDVDTPPPQATIDWTKVVSIVAERPTADDLAKVPSVDAVQGRFPNVGSNFLDFRLTSVLGSGAFGRVYLVKQGAIADRAMVLKLTTKRTTEPQHLGKLHHTNIVPIYSVHEAPPFQALCMPYLGSRTLADILRQYRLTGLFPATVVADGSQSVLSLPEPEATATGVDFERPPALAYADREQIRHVLKLGLDLANGLRHAHERGILHLDVKPANILLTDDGRAMLLDFNLSLDRTAGPRLRAGGTLPYMAPEQLDAYVDKSGDRTLDERTDLYAVGIVLYELLTGTHPFPIPSEITDIGFYAASRRAGATRIPNFAGSIPASVRSIVSKLLQPEPTDRYNSAADLAEDLERELDDRPLRHAANVAPMEVIVKWCRRHTKLAVASLLALVLVVATSLAWSIANERRARQAMIADTRAERLERDLITLRLDLTTTWDMEARTRGLARAEALTAEYGWSADRPTAEPNLAGLSAGRAEAVRERLAELALLSVHARLLPFIGRNDEEARAAYDTALPALQAAHRWNPDGLACAIQATNAAYERMRIRTGIATAAVDRPGKLDHFFGGIRAVTAHDYAKAVDEFTVVCNREPNHFAAQYLLAVALEERGNDDRALERLSVAHALHPQDARPFLRRGAVLLKEFQYDEAEREFTKAIECVDAPAEAIKLRGYCRARLDRLPEALADYTTCIERGHLLGQCYLQRASVYDRLKDPTKAVADRTAAVAYAPTNAYDFETRATTLLPTDPQAALQDFREAARLNPSNSASWINIGFIQAEVLKDPRAALAAYDRAVESAPASLIAHLRRGLLRARQGRRTEAHADALVVLAGKPTAHQFYSLACLYAVTAAADPADEEESLRLLREAVTAGFRDYRLLITDPDLDAMRPRRPFQELVNAVAALHQR